MGTSKLSSTIDSVFESIKEQLEFIFKIQDEEYKNAKIFRDILTYISNKYLKNNRLIIIIDTCW